MVSSAVKEIIAKNGDLPEQVEARDDLKEQKETEALPEGLQEPARQAKDAIDKAQKYLGLGNSYAQVSVEGDTVEYTVESYSQGELMKIETRASKTGRVEMWIYDKDHAIIKFDLSEPALSHATLAEWVARAKALEERFRTMETPKVKVPSEGTWSEQKKAIHGEINANSMPGTLTPSQIETLESLFDRFEAIE